MGLTTASGTTRVRSAVVAAGATLFHSLVATVVFLPRGGFID